MWTDNDSIKLVAELTAKIKETFGEHKTNTACANMIRFAVNELILHCSQTEQESL
jgi:hypothetical protein